MLEAVQAIILNLRKGQIRDFMMVGNKTFGVEQRLHFVFLHTLLFSWAKSPDFAAF